VSSRGDVETWGLVHISPTLRFNQRSNLSGKERVNLIMKMPVAVARTTTSGPTIFAPRGVWLQARKPLKKAKMSISKTLAARKITTYPRASSGLWVTCALSVDTCA
jgi:hypothetical protein